METFGVLKYRKKPILIEAMLFDGSDERKFEVYQWIKRNTTGQFDYKSGDVPIQGVNLEIRPGGYMNVQIATPEGVITVKPGDYVVKGSEGEFYPLKPEKFHALYDLVNDISEKAWA